MKNYNLFYIAGILLAFAISIWFQIAILNSDMPDIWKWWLLK